MAGAWDQTFVDLSLHEVNPLKNKTPSNTFSLWKAVFHGVFHGDIQSAHINYGHFFALESDKLKTRHMESESPRIFL